MEDAHSGPSYVKVWVWLLILLTFGVIAAYLPASRGLVLTLVFVTAFVKAGLVARHFMHLRAEHVLVYVIAGVPIVLILAFALSLIPDIIVNHGTVGVP